MGKKIIMSAFVWIGGLSGFYPGFRSGRCYAKRGKSHERQGAAAKAIKAAVETKDHATVEAKAKDIMGTSDKIVSALPKGSMTGKTKAKAEIWEKSDDFVQSTRKTLNKAAGEFGERSQSRQ